MFSFASKGYKNLLLCPTQEITDDRRKPGSITNAYIREQFLFFIVNYKRASSLNKYPHTSMHRPPLSAPASDLDSQ